MDSTTTTQAAEEYATVESIFIRHRNCLLLRADFSPLFVDHYLHLMQLGRRYAEREDQLFKDTLAYFTLHLVSRPWSEYHAWTLNLCEPVEATVFVSGSSLTEDVIGRVFTEDVRIPEQNTLYTQNILRTREPQNSIIQVHGKSVEAWVEDYYRQSEQRQARAIHLGGDEYVLATAEPGADHDWLDALSETYVKEMLEGKTDDETKILETRRFKFRCGCTLEKVLPTLRAMQGDLDGMLNDDGQIVIGCPRCAAEYTVSPDMLQASQD